ncbi:hypothetical protein GQ600_7539 [Phytophthora cactorum]|nr:hypothetical protein GQ600_7539 [Phytophthora cactorum]
MFTSLGNAMHEKMVAVEPETSPFPSPQLEIKSPYTVNTAPIPTAAKYSAQPESGVNYMRPK